MNEKLELWVQRGSVAAMVALAAGLLALGMAWYLPHPHTTPSVTAKGKP